MASEQVAIVGIKLHQTYRRVEGNASFGPNHLGKTNDLFTGIFAMLNISVLNHRTIITQAKRNAGVEFLEFFGGHHFDLLLIFRNKTPRCALMGRMLLA